MCINVCECALLCNVHYCVDLKMGKIIGFSSCYLNMCKNENKGIVRFSIHNRSLPSEAKVLKEDKYAKK